MSGESTQNANRGPIDEESQQFSKDPHQPNRSTKLDQKTLAKTGNAVYLLEIPQNTQNA
jgi:hypothetical protein